MHYRNTSHYPKCVNPAVVGHDSVTGKVNLEYCKDMRLLDSKCGTEGQHWERKRSVFERLRDKRQALVKSLDERY